jgi:hypothetical protein
MMGAERRSMVMPEEKRSPPITRPAMRWSACLLPKVTHPADPVHKVTIIPRGRALGVTMQPAGARGEKVVRDDTGGAGTSDRRRRASVPTTTGPAPGASPEPQPGV